ncbi:MAG: hypothetical protein FWF00_00885 [Endomicrobia bacterium]|nr:hypothetical protein [Endomicrobiia bacterium]MCL2506229.1 hypothetical protein [Endomicrobiia bacterium]
MEREKIIEVRNAFYKMTLLGFIVYFAGILFCVLFPNFISACSSFMFGTEGSIGQALLIVFGMMEAMIVLFFLIPALVLHWQYKNK